MQAGTIETCLHRQFDIPLQCLVTRSRPDTVRIETLVEHQTLVVRLIVQINLIAFDMHLAHTGITIDLINYISILIQNLVLQIVKERTFRTPGLHLLKRKNNGRQRTCRNRPTGNNLTIVFQYHLQFSSCFFIETRTDNQLLLVDIGQHLN